MEERKRVQKFFNKPSLTRQEFKEQCDLAKLLKRFCKTPEGLAALQNARGFAETARFEDVSMVPDFRAARDAIIAAEAKFMALPAIVRKRFGNDAAEFLDFMQNPANQDEAVKLGLAVPKPVEAVKPVNGA
ncbi:internal scaffolding protein [Apis mellifera associated microvirus 6]|nr:internal scaffolding protein [Apis mellifera associated microvirus 6]